LDETRDRAALVQREIGQAAMADEYAAYDLRISHVEHPLGDERDLNATLLLYLPLDRSQRGSLCQGVNSLPADVTLIHRVLICTRTFSQSDLCSFVFV
jgi:hypothetical protein